jgi:hypothetical protein
VKSVPCAVVFGLHTRCVMKTMTIAAALLFLPLAARAQTESGACADDSALGAIFEPFDEIFGAVGIFSAEHPVTVCSDAAFVFGEDLTAPATVTISVPFADAGSVTRVEIPKPWASASTWSVKDGALVVHATVDQNGAWMKMPAKVGVRLADGTQQLLDVSFAGVSADDSASAGAMDRQSLAALQSELGFLQETETRANAEIADPGSIVTPYDASIAGAHSDLFADAAALAAGRPIAAKAWAAADPISRYLGYHTAFFLAGSAIDEASQPLQETLKDALNAHDAAAIAAADAALASFAHENGLEDAVLGGHDAAFRAALKKTSSDGSFLYSMDRAAKEHRKERLERDARDLADLAKERPGIESRIAALQAKIAAGAPSTRRAPTDYPVPAACPAG